MNAQDKIGHHVPDLFSIETEQGLIGAILAENHLYWRVSEAVSGADFYDPLHDRIWAKIGNLIAKDIRASHVTLSAAMKQDEGLAEVGHEYLEGMARAASTAPAVKDYARIIVDFARRRRVVDAARDAIYAAYYDRDTTPDQIADKAGELIYEAAHSDQPGRGPEPLIDVIRRAAEEAEHARLNPDKAKITTGIPALDQKLGGLFPRDLHVLGAASSMGKSGLLGQIALSASRAGYVGLVFSIEMASEEVATRYLAVDVGVAANRIVEGRTQPADTQRIAEATLSYSDVPYFLDGSSSLSVAQIRARAQATKRRHGALHFIIVDHLRLVRAADRRAPENERIDQIVQDLKAIAKDLNIAVMAISPLNRDFMKRQSHRPILSDLYGSSAIEYHADHVWFLHREEFYLEREQPPETDQKAHHEWLLKMEATKGMAEVFGAKRRGGPLGNARLKFDAPFVRFTEIEQEQQAPQERLTF